MSISRDIYQFLEGLSGFLVLWIFAFSILNVARIAIHKVRGAETIPHNSAIVELAGLPLVLLNCICFVWAVRATDVISVLLFAWWGPGFFATAGYLFYCKRRHAKPNWVPTRRIISWMCKLNYIAFLIVFYWMDTPGMIFVYSAWIINDQFGLAYLSLDADRLRRTFDDRWFIRVLYPLGLFAPFVFEGTAFRLFSMIYGGTLLLLWLTGVYYVKRKGRLRRLPDDPTLLRNMMYFTEGGAGSPARSASRQT